MRILYHHRTQATDAQGIHIHEIISNLKGLGHDVREVALVDASGGVHTSKNTEQRGKIWAWVTPFVPGFLYELMEIMYNFVGARKLRKAIREFQPDMIYERYSLFMNCGVKTALKHDIPIVVELNSPLFLEHSVQKRLLFSGKALRVEKWVASNSTASITVSGVMKDIFMAMGVPESKLVVVPNGVDPDQFHGLDTGDRVRKKFGLENKRVLGFVGWIRDWHGLAELVEAMGGWDDLPDLHLLIVGEGPARSEIESAAIKAGVSDRVHITGSISREDMPDYIATFDVALQPAATIYASPMKVLEYLAMGKPVIACDQTNLRELLTDGYDALFFRPDDFHHLSEQARHLLGDRERLATMSINARKTIFEKQYLWRANAERAVELAVLHGSRGSVEEAYVDDADNSAHNFSS